MVRARECDKRTKQTHETLPTSSSGFIINHIFLVFLVQSNFRLSPMNNIVVATLLNVTMTQPSSLANFKTGMNRKSDEVLRNFIQINENRERFYVKMRKCNLDCFTSKRCANAECAVFKEQCRATYTGSEVD